MSYALPISGSINQGNIMFQYADFDVAAFAKRFKLDVSALKKSEQVTKEKLMVMSRYLLDALHTDEDIRNINAVLRVLTPVNKKVAVHFFAAFSGFKLDAENGVFTTKNEKKYLDARTASQTFLEDPLNNIWSWADKHVQVESKPLDLAGVTAAVQRFLKKAEKDNIPQAEVVKAIIAGGLSYASIIAIMAEAHDAPAVAE
jgi:hypothetical protein